MNYKAEREYEPLEEEPTRGQKSEIETPPLKEARISLIRQYVRAALEDAEFSFDENASNNTFDFKLAGGKSGLRWTSCRIVARENDFITKMTSPIRCDLSNEGALSTLLLLINRINYRLAQGNFELDFQTGEISFKVDVDCAGLDSFPPTFVMSSVFVAKQAWEHYQACFFDVLFGLSDDDERSFALNSAADDD